MADSNVSKISEWVKLYQAVLVETDRDRLTGLVGAAESAIVRRRQELTKCEGADAEREAMEGGRGRDPEHQNRETGLPVINLRSNIIEPQTAFEKIQRVVSIHHWHR